MTDKSFVNPTEACKILGVHPRTLMQWDKNKQIEVIRTPGGKRLYNVNKYISNNVNIEQTDTNVNKRNICYCRVSTHGQKEDLKRQIEFMKKKYPTYELIKDIGSGLNFKHKGLSKIIDYALIGEINELVIAYKDRLCRFGYELIEYIITKSSNGKIIVLNEQDLSPTEEMTKDLVSIINIFSSRINGLRKYKKNIIEKIDETETTDNENINK